MRRKVSVSIEKLEHILHMWEQKRSVITIVRCLHMSMKTVKKLLQENLGKIDLKKTKSKLHFQRLNLL